MKRCLRDLKKVEGVLITCASDLLLLKNQMKKENLYGYNLYLNRKVPFIYFPTDEGSHSRLLDKYLHYPISDFIETNNSPLKNYLRKL